MGECKVSQTAFLSLFSVRKAVQVRENLGILGVVCMDTDAFIRWCSSARALSVCLSPSLFTSRLYLFSVHQHMFDLVSVGGMLTGLSFLLRLWIRFHLSLSRPQGAMVISKDTFWLDWISVGTPALLPNAGL